MFSGAGIQLLAVVPLAMTGIKSMSGKPLTQTATQRQPRDESYDQAIRFLYDRINYERLVRGGSEYPFRLQRIADLLRRLGLGGYLHEQSPRPAVPLVHIAGTKGKGSTAAMVAAAISAAGFRAGLYTSPHLHQLEERFRVDGQPCSSEEVVSLVRHIQPVSEDVDRTVGSPSFFELTTAMALLHFHLRKCDAIVLEVGLGGRLDSTNVCAPTVSAITSIGLDHQHVLGDTLEKIAGEKAGILKPGVPVVSGVQDARAADVISARAAEQGAKLYQLGRDFRYRHQPAADWGAQVEFQGSVPPLSDRVVTDLRMEGEHQSRNAAIAIAIVDVLRSQLAGSFNVSAAAIAGGISQLQCAGRIEPFNLKDDVVAIVDAAHNRDSIDALCQTVRSRVADRQVAVVFGTSIDKQVGPMLQSLEAVADDLVLTRFQENPRFVPVAELRSQVPPSIAEHTLVVEDPIDACRRGLEIVSPGGALVVCGSFFLAAETRQWVQQQAVA